MKKWLLHIIYIGVLVLVASCTRGLTLDTPEASPDSDKVSITFTLSTGGQMAYRSRAVVGGEMIGNSYENEITLEKLQIIAYSTDGKFLKVEDINIVRNWETEHGHLYEFVGKMDYFNGGELNCKFMVFANCTESVSEDTKLSELIYWYDFQSLREQTRGIPMWGVKTISNVTLIPGKRTDLGTIDLLRAMAKIEVKLSDDAAQKYILTKVHMNKYYKEGYCLPAGYAGLAETNDIYVGDDMYGMRAYNPYEPEQTIADGADFYKKDNTYILYMPEYNNGDVQKPKIEIALAEKATPTDILKEAEIYFKDYDSNADFNIVRNHYYIFNVKVKEDQSGNIKTDILSEVEPWKAVDVNSDYE